MLLVDSKFRKHRYSYPNDIQFILESVHDILANSGVKKSIMGRSSVRKMDE